MNKIIYKGLLFLLIEYLLYFAFQLISFLVLKETWKDMSFIPGIVLGIFFVGSAIIIIILMNRQNKNMCLILIVKFFEFGYEFFFATELIEAESLYLDVRLLRTSL